MKATKGSRDLVGDAQRIVARGSGVLIVLSRRDRVVGVDSAEDWAAAMERKEEIFLLDGEVDQVHLFLIADLQAAAAECQGWLARLQRGLAWLIGLEERRKDGP